MSNENNEELDEIFLNSFLKGVQKNQQELVQKKQEARLIAQQKQKKLAPVRKFLQKFVDLGVIVYHNETFARAYVTHKNVNQPEPFTFYEGTSSKGWEPGISIFIEHPASIEIGIPNYEEQGVYIVNVSTEHPDAFFLKQKFTNLAQLCQALAIFIQKNTVQVKSNPDEAINEIENKVRFDGSTLKEHEQSRSDEYNKRLYKNDDKDYSKSTSKLQKFFKKQKDDNEDE